MSIVIPSKTEAPEIGKGDVTKGNYESKMIDYQDAAAQRRLAIQAKQQEMTEESTMRTQMSKSQHEAMMAIIQNFKA